MPRICSVQRRTFARPGDGDSTVDVPSALHSQGKSRVGRNERCHVAQAEGDAHGRPEGQSLPSGL